MSSLPPFSSTCLLSPRRHLAPCVTPSQLLVRVFALCYAGGAGHAAHVPDLDQPLQVLMFVTGEGGTGKSRITGAARAWVSAWSPLAGLSADDAPLRTVAFTGVAAMLVNGATLHSTFGLQFGAAMPTRRRRRAAAAARSAGSTRSGAGAWSADSVDMGRASTMSTLMCAPVPAPISPHCLTLSAHSSSPQEPARSSHCWRPLDRWRWPTSHAP